MSFSSSANYIAAIKAFNQSNVLKEDWEHYVNIGLSLFNLEDYPAAVDAFNININSGEFARLLVFSLGFISQ